MNTFLATISTACIIISAVFIIIGVSKIKKRQIIAHRRSMFWGAVFATLFFAIYAYRTVFMGNTAFGGPDNLKTFYFIFLIVHIGLASLGAVLGIITLIAGYRNKMKTHRKLGPITTKVWVVNVFCAFVVYLLLYVFYSGGETTSLIKAIMG